MFSALFQLPCNHSADVDMISRGNVSVRLSVCLSCLVLFALIFYMSIPCSGSSGTDFVHIELVWTQPYYVMNEPGYILIKLKTTRAWDLRFRVSLIEDLSPGIHVDVLRNITRSHEYENFMIVHSILEINISSTQPSVKRPCFDAFLIITAESVSQDTLFDKETLILTVCEIDPLTYLQEIRKEIEHSNITLSNLTLMITRVKDDIILIKKNLTGLIDACLSNSNSTSRVIAELEETIKTYHVNTRSYLVVALFMSMIILVVVVSALEFFLVRRRKRKDGEEVELMGL